MLTTRTQQHLRDYTCPHCGRPLGRFHAYRIHPDTLLSRLTEHGPCHLECALDAPAPTDETEVVIVWTVKASSPSMPSARVFERLPGDYLLHLYSPNSLTIRHPDGTALTYEEIRDLMMPSIRRAREAATSEEEIDEIARAIAALHPYLPKPNKTTP